MDIYSILSSKHHNKHYLNRYYKFILCCKKYNLEHNITKKHKRNNPTGTYMESHHICPRAKDLFHEYSSFKQFPWNKIDLTLRQHFIAHWLLWKCYNKSQKFAFYAMINKNKHKMISEIYEKLKISINEENSRNNSNRCWVKKNFESKNIHLIELQKYLDIGWVKGRFFNDNHKSKISETQFARYKDKTNNGMYGKKHSEETKLKMKRNSQRLSGENNSMYGKKHSEETKLKMKISAKLKSPMTDQHKQNISKALGKQYVVNGVLYNSRRRASIELNTPQEKLKGNWHQP